MSLGAAPLYTRATSCSSRRSVRQFMASMLTSSMSEVDFSGIKTKEDYFHTVGLPDAAVRESRDRVRSAIKNSGFDLPPTDITINLAPADLKKEGSGFDLPMAIGILGAYGALQLKDLGQFLLVVNWDWMGRCAVFPACCLLRWRRVRVASQPDCSRA